YRASGPGGQKRNKTESAVRLVHTPSGISVVATESRSQHENRARALKRLRKALALRLRRPAPEPLPDWYEAALDKNGRLNLGQRDTRYWPVASLVLDVLTPFEGSVAAAARSLGISTGNLSAFLTADEDLLVEANRIRESLGLRRLRPD